VYCNITENPVDAKWQETDLILLASLAFNREDDVLAFHTAEFPSRRPCITVDDLPARRAPCGCKQANNRNSKHFSFAFSTNSLRENSKWGKIPVHLILKIQ